jgi:hypothetical protein
LRRNGTLLTSHPRKVRRRRSSAAGVSGEYFPGRPQMHQDVFARELLDRRRAAFGSQRGDELLMVLDGGCTGLGAEQLQEHRLVACEHRAAQAVESGLQLSELFGEHLIGTTCENNRVKLAIAAADGRQIERT